MKKGSGGLILGLGTVEDRISAWRNVNRSILN